MPQNFGLAFQHVQHGLDVRLWARQQIVVEDVPAGLDVQEAQVPLLVPQMLDQQVMLLQVVVAVVMIKPGLIQLT